MTNSKIWIYQADRILSEEEATKIRERVQTFLGQWHAHGKALDADFDILYNFLLVLKVNEEQAAASGCSIDKSIALFQEIEQTFDIHLFDRQRFAYEKNGAVVNDHLSNLNMLVNEGTIKADTIVLNNLVKTEEEYQNNFRLPFNQSWHKRLLSNQAVLS